MARSPVFDGCERHSPNFTARSRKSVGSSERSEFQPEESRRLASTVLARTADLPLA